jgi:hypothetical protein
MTVSVVHEPGGRHNRTRRVPAIRTFDIRPEESMASTQWLPPRPV